VVEEAGVLLQLPMLADVVQSVAAAAAASSSLSSEVGDDQRKAGTGGRLFDALLGAVCLMEGLSGEHLVPPDALNFVYPQDTDEMGDATFAGAASGPLVRCTHYCARVAIVGVHSLTLPLPPRFFLATLRDVQARLTVHQFLVKTEALAVECPGESPPSVRSLGQLSAHYVQKYVFLTLAHYCGSAQLGVPSTRALLCSEFVCAVRVCMRVCVLLGERAFCVERSVLSLVLDVPLLLCVLGVTMALASV
jgi:hypothetical protein